MSYFESHDEGTAFTSDGAMETRSERREKGETIVDRIRLGEISVFVALTQELPDVFTAEILPKLDANSTLNLAQVNKAYNDAVWSAEGVRSMQAKIKAHVVEIGKGRTAAPMYLGGKVRQHTRGQGPSEAWGGAPTLPVRGQIVGCGGLRALHVAAFSGHASLVKVLIEAGAHVNVRASNVNPGSASMHTALYAAAQRRPRTCCHGFDKGRCGSEYRDVEKLHPAFHCCSKWTR